MTPLEVILTVVALAGWAAFTLSWWVVKDSLNIVKLIYRDAYGKEIEDD